MASAGNLYGEKQYLQAKQKKLKRMTRENEGKEKFFARGEVDALSGGMKKIRTGDHRDKRAKNVTRGPESGGSDDDARKNEAVSNRILVREHQKQLSIFKKQTVNKKEFNSGKEVPESGNELRKSGGGQNNTVKDVKTPGLEERKPLPLKGLDKTNKTKEHVSLMCHQCMRNDKNGVVICSNCTRKRYCYECLAKWYPDKSKLEIENACPFCCGNCNCKACLREYLFVKVCEKELDSSAKLLRLQYMLYKALPILRHIYGEQNYELEIESKLRGIQLTEKEITRSKLNINERLYWYVLRTIETAGFSF
ncbi:hypothetical protein U1Q18_003522 [Sarracenia purpurea var. burkii]